ncbi:DUF6401 family natural product biosynthesis protein [Micromonospora aurantiaca (nom. illeg.)]|uniref:DUF6401 family natural product biosynthesis protein n=1 Tax=Micromonospora aurantiaca (nom. illeg.) TaxID=47850 RepID=UPI003F4A1900
MTPDQTFRALILLFCLVAVVALSTQFLIFRKRWRTSWWMTGLLVPATLGVLFLIAGTAWAGEWFLLACAVALGFMVVVGWDMHLGARRGDGGRYLAFLARRMIARKRWNPRPDGRPMQSIDELRAEYGQSILDDARRDPRLAHILDQTAGSVEEQIFGGGRSRELPLLQITAYANGLVEGISEPGRRPRRVYRGYSSDMILLAALCQLHDRYEGARTRT